MNLNTLTIISIIAFVSVFTNILFAFRKSNANIPRWSILIFLFVFVLILSWYMRDFSAQWVLIEACTLLGSLLIAMSDNEKSAITAWKFLLLNSFGMGIAFLGLIILSYGAHTVVSMNISNTLKNIQVLENQGTLVIIGIWFVVFGYSAKLGLVPNQYWVNDTYSESPSQISALFASLIPVSIAIALRPLIQMDELIIGPHFSSKFALLCMGIATMLYSIWTLRQVGDIRRITSLIALFHNGSIGVFLWLNPDDEVFFLALSTIVLVKTLLFSAMGVLRLDMSSRNLNEVADQEGLHPISKFLYISAIFMAFAVPVTPMFLTDMLVLKIAVLRTQYWYALIPGMGIL
ncbi:MAG: formate hydrogenase, partial [Leptospiraceae bacterium]|nr:formate hydrogenase [Leptospiraceae bacterium]